MEEENDSTEIINEKEHDALLRDIRHLDNPNKRKLGAATKKPTKKKAPVEKALVLDDLVGAITSTRNVSELKKHLETGEDDTTTKKKRKQRTLSKPLHRQARERVESRFAFRESKKELRQWDPIVQENRAAEQLFFPLNDPNTFFAAPIAEKSKSFTPRTKLEKEMAEALSQSKNVLTNEELYTEAEKELLKAMDLDEAKKRTAKLQKMRSLMSYAEAKNAREARIKSKKYHRIRKREQRKKLIKEIEDMLEKDPEAAKEKLKELDRERAYERATLKHRSTGKWSVQLRQYAANNPGMQKLMGEHLKLGRELKKKHVGLQNALGSDEDSDQDESEQQKPLSKAEMLELAAEQARRELQTEAELDRVKIKKASDNPDLVDTLKDIRKKVKEKEIANVKLVTENIFLNEGDPEEEDDKDGFLAQAFNADDVVGEFADEKQKLEEESKPKELDDRLFGWGSWTGPGISEEKQRKNKERFLRKTEVKPRKDRGKKGLIIRDETLDNKLVSLQPKDVPFPFTAVKDFEAVIRQPLGRDWNTNIAHRNLVKKTVNTKAGRIIRPMDKEDEFRKTTEALFAEKDTDDFEDLLR